MVSLVVSTVLTAFGNYLDSILPFGKIVMTVLNGIVSLALISFLFAAIYPGICATFQKDNLRGHF